jgi:glycerophosphoryl diester phosphodiesterase
VRRRLLGLICAAGLVGTPFVIHAARPELPGTVVSAHRGGADYAPENTLLAFRNAVRLGVDELEADVRATSDGELVIIHDDTLDRTTDCAGPVIAATMAQVANCDAAYRWSPDLPLHAASSTPLRGTGVRVPRLAELLALVVEADSVTLLLELKQASTAVVGAVVAEIERSGIDRDHMLVQSFSPGSIEDVKRLDPGLRTRYLVSSKGSAVEPALSYVIARGHEALVVNHNAPDLTVSLFAAAHDAGKEILAYTPDTATAMQAALDKGADGLVTDRPACLLALLDRRVPDEVAVVGDVALCEGEPASLRHSG